MSTQRIQENYYNNWGIKGLSGKKSKSIFWLLNFVNTLQFRSTFVLKYTLIPVIFNYRYENLNEIISLTWKKE